MTISIHNHSRKNIENNKLISAALSLKNPLQISIVKSHNKTIKYFKQINLNVQYWLIICMHLCVDTAESNWIKNARKYLNDFSC